MSVFFESNNLRVCFVLQVIEKALIFLRDNEDFDGKTVDRFQQPLLKDAHIIEAQYVWNAIKLVEICTNQQEILIETQDTRDDVNIAFNRGIEKDILLFKGKSDTFI